MPHWAGTGRGGSKAADTLAGTKATPATGPGRWHCRPGRLLSWSANCCRLTAGQPGAPEGPSPECPRPWGSQSINAQLLCTDL